VRQNRVSNGWFPEDPWSTISRSGGIGLVTSDFFAPVSGVPVGDGFKNFTGCLSIEKFIEDTGKKVGFRE